jgi:hypothetical protein
METIIIRKASNSVVRYTMKNAAYYIILCIISTVMFVYSLIAKKDNKLIVYYFSVAGVTYLLEYLTIVVFNGYFYYPRILRIQYLDNVLGAVASDGFTIPMIGTFIAAFRFNFLQVLLVAAVMTIIEVIFVNMGLFEHHWWSYLYTFTGAVIVFYFGQIWLAVLRGKISYTVRYITLFFSNLLIQSTAVFILAGILNLYFYKVNWFNDPYRNHIAFATLYIIFIAIIFTSVIAFRLKWFWAGIGILLPSLTDIILLKLNMLSLSDKWSLLNFIILRIFIFACLSIVDKYLLTEADDFSIN